MGVVAAGAHLAVVPAQADRLRIAAVVPVVPVAVPMGLLMAVAVVGLLVNPAVEQVGEQIADHNPAQQGDGAALPGRVGNQIKAHHAEHHPGGEPQQQAHRPVRGAVDRRGQGAAQSQSAHPRQRSDKKNLYVYIHRHAPII